MYSIALACVTNALWTQIGEATDATLLAKELSPHITEILAVGFTKVVSLSITSNFALWSFFETLQVVSLVNTCTSFRQAGKELYEVSVVILTWFFYE
jgi:hypothetical protein